LLITEDGFVISGVYGESDEPHMTVDDDDTGDGKEMSEGDGEEDEEEEDVSKKYSKVRGGEGWSEATAIYLPTL